MIEGQASRHAGSACGSLWANAAGGIYQQKSGIALADIQPHLRAASIRTPTLVAHGSADRVVPSSAGRRLFAALPATTPRKFVEIPDAGHDNVLITDYPIYAEILQSEIMFYAKSSRTRKADNVFDGSNALAKGECAFAYVSGLTTAGNPAGTPIVLFPMVPGKHLFDYEFCKKYYNGAAVILRLDNSVTTYPVDKSGRVWIDGKDLFDPTQPFWNGKVPDVKWPE